MKSIKLLFFFLVAVGMNSCHKKEVFPDLAKEIEGTYYIAQANSTYNYYAPNYKPSKITGPYNLKDSSQTGQVIIQKIDALGANIHIQLKKQTGEIFFRMFITVNCLEIYIIKGGFYLPPIQIKAGLIL